MMAMLSTFERARTLLSQGFRLLPLLQSDAGWVPATDGFGADVPEASFGLEWFGDPDTEIAILLGPNASLALDEQLIAIDVDGDPATHPEMQAFLDTLPTTLSGHDGRHLYFRAPAVVALAGPAFKRPGVDHDGLDVKGAGGYVRARWTWSEAPSLEAVAELPAAAIDALRAARSQPAAVAAEPDEAVSCETAGLDPAVVRGDAERWLLTQAPLPTEGTGGVTLLIVFGALLVGFGLDDATALELAIDVYTPRAWPGQEPDIDGFEHKIETILRDGSERFQALELAQAANAVRAGWALTLPDASVPLPTTAGVPAPSTSVDEQLRTWDFHLARTPKGEIRTSTYNTHTTLSHHPEWCGLFGYDEFAHTVVFLRKSTIPGLVAEAGTVFHEDNHPEAIRIWFSRYLYEVTATDLIRSVHHVARQKCFHSVQNYLRSLVWDGVDRDLSAYFGCPVSAYHSTLCRKWLRGAVARAMVPGSQMDTMLILEGEQGWRKSSALRALCPDVRWYYEAASRAVGSKDFLQDMSGKWLCEIPEVDQLVSSRDESELKALLTRRSDNYRPCYARRSDDFPRQLVFAGTTNKTEYLIDTTGNRRYWSVACGVVRDDAIAQDRDQLWAQAFHEYQAGERWWLEADEEETARDEQDARLERDAWEEPLLGWMDEWGDRPFTVVDALGGLPGAKPVADMNRADTNRMGKLLRKLGMVKTRVRTPGTRAVLWSRPSDRQ